MHHIWELVVYYSSQIIIHRWLSVPVKYFMSLHIAHFSFLPSSLFLSVFISNLRRHFTQSRVHINRDICTLADLCFHRNRNTIGRKTNKTPSVLNITNDLLWVLNWNTRRYLNTQRTRVSFEWRQSSRVRAEVQRSKVRGEKVSVPGAADGSSADSSAAHVDRRRTRNLLWKSTTSTSSENTSILCSARLHDLGGGV